ncbi:amidase family protein [Roseospirillum parvum]|uniref:amidase family protein n=1 Tax=Roseospirillum parvum TaxID=83401 RepID=UPI001FDF40FF|nr:amidase family protein [Roseospirillum parvum]
MWADPARRVVDRLRRREIAPAEVIDSALDRIEAVDPLVNAVPTRCVERARAMARDLARDLAATTTTATSPEDPAWLAGLPVLIKDLNDVAGVRTTYGSPLFANHVPNADDLVVRALAARGATLLGKTNTPEFGAGAHTFNEVFGATRNPWNTARSAGGSSGGSAAALASGMAWLAHGNDLGGSLRIPAAFCGVVGLRPSPGRVPHSDRLTPFSPLNVDGPMARDVADLALLLDAMAVHARADPLSFPTPPGTFQAAAAAPTRPARLAFSMDLGLSPVDGRVRAVLEDAVKRLEAAGFEIEDATPELSDAVPCFQILRAHWFATRLGPLLAERRAEMKPELVWNIELGLALSAEEIAWAERARARLVADSAAFFETYDLLLTPTTVVPPFPLGQRAVEEVEGHKLATYIDWLVLTFAITLTGCPALSLPAGQTPEGLPVGLQAVGRPRGEAALIAAAAALEEALEARLERPIEPRVAEPDDAQAAPSQLGAPEVAPPSAVTTPPVKSLERRLREGLEQMPAAFALWGEDDRLIIDNAAHRRLFGDVGSLFRPGVSFREVLVGLLDRGIHQPEPGQEREDWIADRLAARHNGDLRREWQMPDGHWLRIQETRTPGGMTVTLGLDITDLKGKERELIQERDVSETASQAKSQFLARMSHELRTPLNAIIGFSEVVRGQLLGPIGNDIYLGYADDIWASGHHLLELISDILDLSKIEAGTFTIHPQPLGLGDLLEASVPFVRARAKARGQVMSLEVHPRLPRVLIDRRAAKQILLNLLSNAIKFTPQGGRIWIRLIRRDADVVLSVKDNGIGMSQEDVARALEPFGQIGGGESWLTPNTEGTGLGLTIVDALVGMHGARLEIDSAPGEGTDVRVVFPPPTQASR